MKQLHENGYRFVGDTSFYNLTISEIRVLLEGVHAQNEEQSKQSGTTRGSGPHERAPGQPRQSDKGFVEELAQQQ